MDLLVISKKFWSIPASESSPCLRFSLHQQLMTLPVRVRLFSHKSREITINQGRIGVTLSKTRDYNREYKTWGLNGFDVLAKAAL